MHYILDFYHTMKMFAAFVLLATHACLAIGSQDETIVANWEFGSEEATALKPYGGVHRDQPGPRPPEFPDFELLNTAVLFDGQGSHYSFEDPGQKSRFDFTNGDAITLEAWVRVDDLKKNENLYVIGKGRTGAAKFKPDNQNWALRVREVNGQARTSFLFATPIDQKETAKDAHWHRWTTSKGFVHDTGWHHIAVAYQFGEPDSIHAWIDGQRVSGAWDMGGATREAPVVDNDEIWIASSQGGNAGNSFRGLLDSIAIHRKVLDDATIKGRFRRDGSAAKKIEMAKAKMPDLGKLPDDSVLCIVHEAMPAHERWLKEDEAWPPESDRWTNDAFLLSRLPLRLDDWGIRDAWNAPVLLRMAADIPIENGPRQFLLRARGLSRLWVDGQLVASTKPILGSPSGEEPVKPVAEPPRPGLSVHGFGQQEVLGDAIINGDGKCRVVLETIVGGKKFRPAPGEICLAVSTIDGQSFVLLDPFGPRTEAKLLTRANIDIAMQSIETSMANRDDHRRRTAAESQDRFWSQRHALASQLASASHDASRSIDAFIASKIERALEESVSSNPDEAQHFRESVLPILSDHCFRCHGEKENGGLKLNSRDAFLKGGDSESAAFVPGDVDASEAISRIRSDDEDVRMPPTGEPLSREQIKTLEAWVRKGANWTSPQIAAEDVALHPVIDDAAFIRRISLDTIGIPPTESEVREFLSDRSPDKRRAAIDRLLDDDRYADHWMSYWQDILAENPTLLNASLNSTGPFRWFLWDSLRDNKPIDRWVTELIMMRGGVHEGGSAGFALAGDNDAPLASKGQILASAFLAVELQCARCHDSPYHSTKQKDLFSLAAMLGRKAMTVPKTSMVPAAFFEKQSRESLIKATLKPDESVLAEWPFAEVTGTANDESVEALVEKPNDSRERLAALITGPQNKRFANVLANRIWRRLMGAGIVEPPQDWEGRLPSHPELLDWMAEELVIHRYDVKHLLRLICSSEAYQRPADGYNLSADPEMRFFNAPDRRRMTAEQVVDSLYACSGTSIEVEEMTFDPDGRRATSNRLSLGHVKRAWMFATLNNERDRPSLTLPRAQAIDDVLRAFGWSGARQMPRTDRETSTNVLQPGVLANSTLSVWLTSASEHSTLAQLAVDAESPEVLTETLFLRYLGRFPNASERKTFVAALATGFDNRLVASEKTTPSPSLPVLPRVTWSNHLTPEATIIQNELERRARNGSPSDPRIETQWREIYEDVTWSLVNHREFVWLP
ncbi:MAG: DUF1553 domain-containing protein [Pirellulaceae bacterium]|nr:DUF1553 domain-containing protein [Pirellulaceae bacterium]